MLSPENPHSADPEIETAHAEEFVEQLRKVTDTLPSRINVDAQSVEQGLANGTLEHKIGHGRQRERVQARRDTKPLVYTSKPHGLVWALFTIFAVVACDAAALLVGSRIGRHQFFATISPKKTVEGAIAGVLGAIAVMLIGVSAVIGLSPLHAIALGLLVGVSAQVGDLVESQMKRIAEVKDSSNLIPGHGGVLDRLDSILFPPILVYFYVTMFLILK